MKRLKCFYYRSLCVLIISIGFVNCTNNDDDQQESYSITGEWFVDESSSTIKMMKTIEFLEDGYFKGWTTEVSKVDNYRNNLVGTYNFTSGLIDITYSEVNSPKQVTNKYHVNSADKYTLNITDNSSGYQSVFHKIINTINMTVGDNKPFTIPDTDFSPISYKSCDESIAVVNSSGIIHAIKRGTTYIRVMAPVGEADVRVIVTDPNNVIDDYTKYIGINYINVVNDYGRAILEGEMTSGQYTLKYEVLDDISKEVNFFYHPNNQVYEAIIAFQEDVDLSGIISAFDEKYEKRTSKDPAQHFYHANNGDESIIIDINETFNGIMYKLDYNAFEEYDYFIMLDIDQALDQLKVEYNKEELHSYYGVSFDLNGNEYFDNLSIEYNPNTLKITEVTLKCKLGVSARDIESWYKNHYFKTGYSDYKYGTHANNLVSDYFISIYRNSFFTFVKYADLNNKKQ